MRKTVLNLILMLLASVSFAQDDQEWTELFNGENLDNWVVKINKHHLGDNHANTFRVEDGLLKVRYDDYDGPFDDQFGHIYFDRPYSRYHLSIEYRFVGEPHDGCPGWARGNSGVMLHCQDPRTIGVDQDFPICIETQFLAGLEPGEDRPTGNLCTPGTDVDFEGKFLDQHCLNSSSETYPVGEWVHAEVMVYGDSLVQHLINGEVVLEYTNLRMGGGVVSGFDEDVKVDGKPVGSGYISLQSEGHPIDFRSVRIRGID